MSGNVGIIGALEDGLVYRFTYALASGLDENGYRVLFLAMVERQTAEGFECIYSIRGDVDVTASPPASGVPAPLNSARAAVSVLSQKEPGPPIMYLDPAAVRRVAAEQGAPEGATIQ